MTEVKEYGLGMNRMSMRMLSLRRYSGGDAIYEMTQYRR